MLLLVEECIGGEICVTKFIDTKKQIINTRDYNPSEELYLTGAKTISMNEQCHTN